MKLRNKKTGEIGELLGTERAAGLIIIDIDFRDGNPRAFDYTSINQLNEDWEDCAETDEPDPSFLIVKIQQLENSVKALDERLKTVEEITERLLREDNEQILGGKVKRYEPGMPQSVVFERMKQDLRDWIEKNEIGKIRVFHYSDPAGRRGVLFKDKTNKGENTLVLIGWPTIGLRDGGTYTPDELLITGEAGKE